MIAHKFVKHEDSGLPRCRISTFPAIEGAHGKADARGKLFDRKTCPLPQP
jgi:hypothetical protein